MKSNDYTISNEGCRFGNAEPVEGTIPADGGDVIFVAGRAAEGGHDGSVVLKLADDTELVRFKADQTVEVLGERVSFEDVRRWIRENRT